MCVNNPFKNTEENKENIYNKHFLLFPTFQKQITLFISQKNQRTEGPESRTDGETLIFWD